MGGGKVQGEMSAPGVAHDENPVGTDGVYHRYGIGYVGLHREGPEHGRWRQAALLVSVERGGIDAVKDALVKIGATIRSSALVGSHATRYTIPAKA